MPTIERVDVNIEKLDALIGGIQNPDALVEMLAQDMVADIGENWNAISPAPAGEAPGVVSSALANSVRATRLSPGLWAVRDGVEYGIDLELGIGMAARPWMRPAAERTAVRFPGAVQSWIEEQV